ncbi:MAG: DUF3301 domain-containing protein [Pseudomonadota bacterium]|nr:MAG: DUF3301 domain-containing protein [Pseudomonadota bacterium]
MISSFYEVIAILALLAATGYWMAAIRSKEIARAAGRGACERAGVQFLDDTVELTRLRLRRDRVGRMAIYREYRFEFTSDGASRCRGELATSGNRVIRLTMEPYRATRDLLSG